MRRGKEQVIKDIINLEKANKDFAERFDNLRKEKKKVFAMANYAKLKPYMYRRMPLDYVNTAFRYYRDYLRDNCDFCMEIADRRERYRNRCITAACVECGGNEDNVILMLSDPHGIFAAKTGLSPEEGRSCVGKLYHLQVSSVFDESEQQKSEKMAAEEWYIQRVLEADSRERFYKIREYPEQNYEKECCFVIEEMTLATFPLKDAVYSIFTAAPQSIISLETASISASL